MPSPSETAAPMKHSFMWLLLIPFGKPVVPEV
jgi:hypothetical protein